MPNFETLLGTSSVLLYGRILLDIQLTPRYDYNAAAKETGAPPRAGRNRFLQDQLSSAGSPEVENEANAPRLARIYGFAYEGAYYELMRPVIFLVHGEGDVPEPNVPINQFDGNPLDYPTGSVDGIGVPSRSGHLASDVRVWAYDRLDVSLRMDVETGTLAELLLEAELMADDGGLAVSGANVRGANVRGANVRGANVRGANVRGANVRGANVRGANVRGGSD